ncbi:Type I restriction modification DNA specificity domain protein [Roseisalinus antarcticus]|uniref:Type I restriction modification DNA specificity domain protein n=1 Tax=Roseisalinus antarcticus TaxID=254357 RepID=A0A1Y5U0B3_9RHOB|nr:Type I restriction modification DNA specificity domain protein [Roseisalinus antarcticus]
MRERPQSFPSVALAKLVQKGRKITYGIVQPGEFVADGVILVRGRDYSAGWRDIDGFMRVTPEIDAPYKRSKLKPGDLVLTIVGANTGTVAVVPAWLDGANITQTTARIAVDSTKAIPGYVEQVLRSAIGQEAVYRFQKGGAQPGLNLADVEKFEIPLPPLPEQRKIAEILRTWDQALEKITALRALNIRRRVWFRTHLFTGKVRLPGFTGEWREVPLSDVLHEHGSKSTGAEEVYSVSVHKGLVNQVEHLGRSFSAANTDHYNRVLPGDIVYTKSPTGDFPLGIIKQSKIDREVTHELCHVAEPHHGAAFFELLDKVMPDWERRKQRLERAMA